MCYYIFKMLFRNLLRGNRGGRQIEDGMKLATCFLKSNLTFLCRLRLMMQTYNADSRYKNQVCAVFRMLKAPMKS